MPPAETQISCPNCQQPVRVHVEQLFDLYDDPSSKERLLSGAVNFIRCPHCGFQGELATPIVYHDPGKELLLSYVPASLGMRQAEQERAIGSLINQVMNRLPQEMRKGYLLNPQPTLTHEGLIERILEGDGITREMIQAQQNKARLLQRLASMPGGEGRDALIKEEDELIDAEFFALLTRLIQTSVSAGDEESIQRFSELQTDLLSQSAYGQEMQGQIEEIQAAAEALQAEGEGLTRERLLDLVIEAPNATRVRSYVSLARDGMDYQFFQLLTGRIDAADGDEKEALTRLRAELLELTSEVDKQIEARMHQS
ncbi:MAG: CpXC domain-containing protein, partial [Anaerolineales bacterium]|nr:CpXC domain-containing protein [Anaerolineales bacterium]